MRVFTTSPAAACCVVFLLGGCNSIVHFYEDGAGGDGAGGQGSTSTVNPQGGAFTTPSVTTDSTSTSTNTSTSTGISPVGGGGPGLTEEVVIEGEFAGTITVTTQPGDLGVTAFLEADDFASVSIVESRAPSGSVVVSGTLPNNGYVWEGFGTVAMAQPLVEHPETFPFAQGPWSFDYTADAPAKASAWVRRTVDGNFHGGVLDINVFLPDGLIDDSEVLPTIEDAFSDWGGISLGDVRFFPISDEYFIIDDNTLLGAVQETSAAPTRPALNIIATGEISGAFEGAAGFALGVPGLPLVHGTFSSAVVWMVFYDDFIDGLILRHEAGHYSGLFHTSEFAAGFGDTLSDTPICADAENLFESCPDYAYAMFPSGGSGQGLFSNQQQKVMQASALYRGVFAPGEQPMDPYGLALESAQSKFKLALPEDFAQAARTRAARGPSPRASWGHELPNKLRGALEGIGCPTGTNYFDDLETMVAASAIEDETLLALAWDADAPVAARYRALRLLERKNGTFDANTVRWLVTDESEAVLVRSAALALLAGSADPTHRAEARAFANGLGSHADKKLARLAKRYR